MSEHCCDCSDEQEGAPAAAPIAMSERVQYADDSIVSSTIVDNDAGTLTLFAFAEGQALSTHSAPFEAVVQVFDGEAEITVGGIPHRVTAGQMIVMPADVPHAVKAVSRFKMVLTLFRP